MNWKKYKKLIAAGVGLAVLVVIRENNITVPGLDALVMELIVSALTAFGVYQASNEQ